MMYYTHIATSVAIASVGASILTGEANVGFIAGVALGALMPDIDEPNSKIGRKIPIIPHIIKFLFRHRGITHSIPMAMMVAALMGVLMLYFSPATMIFAGIALGYLLHILEDMFFEKGVPLWKPFSNKRYWLIGFTVGGIMEKIIFLIMCYIILDVYLLHNIFA